MKKFVLFCVCMVLFMSLLQLGSASCQTTEEVQKLISEFSASLLGLKQANVISFPQNDKEGPGSDERKPKTDRSNR